jgi:hypothetical protein
MSQCKDVPIAPGSSSSLRACCLLQAMNLGLNFLLSVYETYWRLLCLSFAINAGIGVEEQMHVTSPEVLLENSLG